MILRSFLVLISGFVCVFCISAWSDTKANDVRQAVNILLAQETDKLAKQYGGETLVKFEIETLDQRLRLGKCNTPLDTDIRGNQRIGRINVKVSCSAPGLWTIYVPAKIEVFQKVLVASAALATGTFLGPQHLHMAEVDITNIRGQYFTFEEDAIGMRVKRAIGPGATIIKEQLEPPIVIKKGDSVVVSASSGLMAVKTTATALSDGREGEQISVKNRRSQRIIEAEVVGPGRVKIAM